MTTGTQRALAYLGIAGSIASLIGLYYIFWSKSGIEGRYGMALLSTFAWFFFIFALVQEYRYSRKARYAESVFLINRAYNQCISAIGDRTFDKRTAQEYVRSVCSDLADAFSLITGARCSVCAKVMNSPSASGGASSLRLTVSTLCRDKESQKREYSKPGVIHYLDLNSDFRELFEHKNEPKGEVFFENDLPSHRSYSNTSFQIHGEPKDIRFPFLRGVIRNHWWPLPYRSAIVVPILPANATAETQVVGFLCVDCASRRVFKKRYDIDLMRGMAAGLYPVVFRWTEAVLASAPVALIQETQGERP